MYAKLSKCSFEACEVEFLGHAIFKGTMAIDNSKGNCIAHWPILKSIKELRALLGISGYYRRFVKHYGTLTKSLINLLKKKLVEVD